LLEAFKEIRPVLCPDDEHVSAVVLVPFAAQIAEAAKRVQGARDDRLGNSKHLCQPTNRVRAGRQIDQHQQGHLAVR
jgi:hypothetical protein